MEKDVKMAGKVIPIKEVHNGQGITKLELGVIWQHFLGLGFDIVLEQNDEGLTVYGNDPYSQLAVDAWLRSTFPEVRRNAVEQDYPGIREDDVKMATEDMKNAKPHQVGQS